MRTSASTQRWFVAIALVLVTLLVITGKTQAENWPSWRGPQANGISQEKNTPYQWSPTENVVWRLPLPGPGGATPIVWNDHIFVTSVDGRDLVLWCVSTAGKPLWKRTVGSGNKDVRGDEGNSASPSPVTDGKHVWALFANGLLASYDFDGNQAWRLDLQERYGKFDIAFGMTATPILDGERLYLQLIHGDGNPETREAIVVALDKSTGKQIWKHDRASDARAECEHSYASPRLYRDDKREYLLTHGADFIVAHSLDDGSEIWRCGDLNPKGDYEPTLRFVSTPVVAPGVILVPSAKGGPVFAIHADVKGDITDDPKAYHWKMLRGTPDVPSPLIHDGLVYLCRENGDLTVLELKSGEKVYQERTERGRHRASPVFADGKIYLTARNDGIITVIKAGREFEILSKNEMGEAIAASPVISGGRIYLRSFDALYAIGR